MHVSILQCPKTDVAQCPIHDPVRRLEVEETLALSARNHKANRCSPLQLHRGKQIFHSIENMMELSEGCEGSYINCET